MFYPWPIHRFTEQVAADDAASPFGECYEIAPAVPGEEMAIEIIEESLPRRAARLSPGFQPGNRPKPHRALKGRHIDWPSSVKKTMSSPPVSACTSTGDST